MMPPSSQAQDGSAVLHYPWLIVSTNRRSERSQIIKLY